MSELDSEKDVLITFKDIYRDYRNFKEAYYYSVHPDYVRPPPKQVDVDMKTFSLKQKVWDSVFYGAEQAHFNSATSQFSRLCLFTGVLLFLNIAMEPTAWLLDWRDPLGDEEKEENS